MRKIVCFLPLLLLFIATACEETKEIGKYDNWQARNEAFIDSLQGVYDAKSDLELLSVIDSRNKSQRIFFKKLPGNTVKEDKYPLYTDSVKAFYRGMLINEKVFAATPMQKYYTMLYKNLDVFDQNFMGDSPSEFDNPIVFKIDELIDGWVEILQRMKVGEHWEVYIPWQSAYGASANSTGTIPGYSTLIFDLQLEGIQPKQVFLH
ncbi:FKBP-type 22 kDa peptidyl-prolyl cis-trans isomerase [termite gut metagenome]|uniref:peptidylprolyl isomerase n=1 Tax=termite gut metagenome TaxID=433724 RepID=A0A5J4SNN2_9ZZZZ